MAPVGFESPLMSVDFEGPLMRCIVMLCCIMMREYRYLVHMEIFS